jgi:hypothetical protein
MFPSNDGKSLAGSGIKSRENAMESTFPENWASNTHFK